MTLRRTLVLLPLLAALIAGSRAQTTPTVTESIPDQVVADPVAIDLRGHFGLPDVEGPVAQFRTVVGTFNVELLPDVAPKNAANFQSYVEDGIYNNTIIHRSATFDQSTPAIVQGGGYRAVIPPSSTVKKPAVELEYELPNARGTLAAARTSAVNSATSEWFFNVKDNSTTLNEANNGGYTVFGRVLGEGMEVVDAMAAVEVWFAGNTFGQPFSEMPLIDYSTGSVQPEHLLTIQSVTMLPIYPENGGDGVLMFAAESANPAIATVALNGSTLTISAGTGVENGSTTVTVTASDVDGSIQQTTFAVTVQGNPVVTLHPESQTIAAGGNATFTAATSGAGTYQWTKDGEAIDGATSATLALTGLTAADSGEYAVVITNNNGSTTSRPATLLVATPVNGGLVNLSARARAAGAEGTVIAGFAIVGEGDLSLTARVVGPGLAQFVDGALADPEILLLKGSTGIAGNDDWTTDNTIPWNGLPLEPGSKDAVINPDLAPGVYTAHALTKGDATGLILFELYDASDRSGGVAPGAARLVNLSSRAYLGTGDDVLIAGFIIDGNVPKRILIRGIGPGLTGHGVEGILEDPKLSLYDADGALIAENDNWVGDDGPVDFELKDGSKDAVLSLTLTPGSYTAIVHGVGDTSGVALVEVYELP